MSNIAMEEDAREEDKNKSVIDMDKLNADIAANKALAQQVRARPGPEIAAPIGAQQPGPIAGDPALADRMPNPSPGVAQAARCLPPCGKRTGCCATNPQGKVAEAVEGLLNLEKAARQGEDITATKATCSAVLEVCFEAKQWKLLEENVMLLSKRRSQLKQVRQLRIVGQQVCSPGLG